MLTVVLDSNVLVSAFITPHGESDEIVRRAKEEVLCLSPFIFAEVATNLRSPRLLKKYHYSAADLKKYAKSLYKASRVINAKQLPSVCSDEDDNHILACAIEAQAEYLVTRNIKHFPRNYAGVTVITPNEFLSIVRS